MDLREIITLYSLLDESIKGCDPDVYLEKPAGLRLRGFTDADLAKEAKYDALFFDLVRRESQYSLRDFRASCGRSLISKCSACSPGVSDVGRKLKT